MPEEETSDLQLCWLPTTPPLPLFIAEGADADKVLETAKSHGYPTFFILASHRPTYKEKGKTVRGAAQPKIFRFSQNVATESVSVLDHDYGLTNFDEMAWFLLPKIPWKMIQKLDAFFRAVEKRYGSEAIVVLTFDKRYLETKDPEGWGFAVPRQNNSAGHCHYEPASTMDVIPNDVAPYVVEVGTAHSHPGMSAFASGTDTHDQEQLGTGVHITFGWKPNRPTEFYAELQDGSTNYELAIEYLFENIPPTPEYDDMDDLVDRIGAATDASGCYEIWAGSEKITMPRGAPDPMRNVVIANRRSNTIASWYCPICFALMTEDAIARRRCQHCWCYVCDTEETVADAIAARKLLGDAVDTDELEGNTPRPVVFWRRWWEANCLHEETIDVYSAKKA